MRKDVRKYYSQKVIPFHNPRALRYPNGFDRNDKMNKLTDIFLSFATCLGSFTVIVYLMLL